MSVNPSQRDRSVLAVRRQARAFAGWLSAVSAAAVALAGCATRRAPDAVSTAPQAGPATAGVDQPGAAPGGQQSPADQGPISQPPRPPPRTTNPLIGAKLFVDPESLVMLRANSLRRSQPQTAAILDRIGQQPQAMWLGEWNADIHRCSAHLVARAQKDGSVPVMIAYNIPHRDCGQHSKGGMSSGEAYQWWVRNLAAGIGAHPAVVVLEPDALGHIQECLTDEQRAERFALIKDAVWVLRQNPKTAVYVDAGHARWVKAEKMAPRLRQAGVEDAHGFALNTSNYVTTEENLEYGKRLSALVGGAHFVIDTSRNGNGPAPGDEWCNPAGRKIGQPPTTNTGEPLCDAYLWLKRPGESDGECNGGPRAGVLWLERALELAQ